MRFLLALICLVCATPLFAQEQITYDSEKQKLYARLTSKSIGPNYSAQINQFFNSTCDSLINAGTRVDEEPIKSTLTKYFQATLTELEKQNMSALRVPNLNDNFLRVLRSYKREPLKEVFLPWALCVREFLPPPSGYAGGRYHSFLYRPPGDDVLPHPDSGQA